MSCRLGSFSMCWNTTSHRLRLGFCGSLETVSVLAPTAYERVQNRQYTGQIEVAKIVSFIQLKILQRTAEYEDDLPRKRALPG